MARSSLFVVSLGSAAFAAAFLAVACGGETPSSTSPTTSASAPVAPPPSATGDTSATASASASVPPAPTGPTPIFHLAGFQTPESIAYDDGNDRYLVSNVNGNPAEADNNGYISLVSPDGKVILEKFIAGGVNKVTLSAPKGTAIANGNLYVSDISSVRIFDLKTGAPKGEVKIPGATFLNDVDADSSGKVYVSDTGVKVGAHGFEPTGTDAVYVIDKTNKVKTLLKDKTLEKPNGVYAGDKAGLWVVTFGAPHLYRIDDKGKKQDETTLPAGQLDGIIKNGDDIYISSWETSSVYKGKPGGTFAVVIPNVKSPADIGLDTKRKRILVPLFTENAIEAYDIQ
jgi:sugar lactone lactonase YvrE